MPSPGSPPATRLSRVSWQGNPTDPDVADLVEFYATHGCPEVPLLTWQWFFDPPKVLDAPLLYGPLGQFIAEGTPTCPRPLPQEARVCVDIESPWRGPFNSPNQASDGDATISASKYLGAAAGVSRGHTGPMDAFKLAFPSEAYGFRRDLRRLIQGRYDSLSWSLWRSGQAQYASLAANLAVLAPQIDSQFELAAEFGHPMYGWIWARYQGTRPGLPAFVPLTEQREWLAMLIRPEWPWAGWIVLGGDTPQGNVLAKLAMHMLD